MPDDKARAEVNLKNSICTDTPTGTDLYQFGDPAAQHIHNTGIERNGGIQNLYLKIGTFPTAGAATVITKTGQVLQVDSSNNVRLNNNSIGNVGPYAISMRGALAAYSDAAWSASNTIIGILKVGSAIQVDELNPATGTVINTRRTTFNMPAITITNIVLQKYVGMAYADSATFVISNSQITYSLVEASAPIINIVGGFIWNTSTLATNTWNSVAWSPALGLFVAVGGVVGGTNYAASSPEGITWTLRTLATGTWNSVAWSPALGLFAAVGSGSTFAAASSSDGITWTTATLPSDSFLRGVCWAQEKGIFVAVSEYIYTSSNGTTWTKTATINSQLFSVAWSPTLGLFAAVGVGGIYPYAFSSPDGITWTGRTLATNTWNSVAWSPALGLFVAVGGGTTNYAASSPDGITWTTRTLATNTWTSVAWSPFLGSFVAVGATISSASSSDGITWTQSTLETNTWESVVWSSSLLSFIAVGSGGTHYSAKTNQSIYGTNFVWRLATTTAIIGNQSIGNFAIGNIAATMTAISNATWCVIDQFAGTAYSQAILTFPVAMVTATMASGIGIVGYNQAGTLSATPTYYGPVGAATFTLTVGAHSEGPGYSESVFSRSDVSNQTLYYQAPIMSHQPGPWYDYQQQTGTGTSSGVLCNGFGRLNDFNNNALGNTCALRVLMTPASTTSGIPTGLAAAQIGQAATTPQDCIGVPLTLNGEFDYSFMPHVVDNGSSRVNVIYRYNGVLIYLSIQSGVANTISRISDKVYMINCLSPNNCVDIQKGGLFLGANDYNGRILKRGSGTQITTTGIVAVMQGQHAYSIDTGIKQIVSTFTTSTDIVPGIALPTWIDRAIPDFGVNVYANSVTAPVYSTTYEAFNITIGNAALVAAAYTSEATLQPLAMGYTFYDKVFQSELETLFLGVSQPPPLAVSPDILYDYLGYMTGNQLNGAYQGFTLYGQPYVFDGTYIYAVTFNQSAFEGRGLPIAVATGLQLIAVAPTQAFFLSTFDNSIHLYNGARDLVKRKRMNQLENVINGAYSVRDNAVMLQTANHFVYISDNIASYLTKTASQTAVSIYDTTNGLVIANNIAQWNYTFEPLPGSSPVALNFQTAYFAIKNNMRAILAGITVYIYSATKAAIPLTLTIYTMDTDGLSFASQPRNVTINPNMYDINGIALYRVQPQTTKALAMSLQIQSNVLVTITKIVPEFRPEAAGVSPADRSG